MKKIMFTFVLLLSMSATAGETIKHCHTNVETGEETCTILDSKSGDKSQAKLPGLLRRISKWAEKNNVNLCQGSCVYEGPGAF